MSTFLSLLFSRQDPPTLTPAQIFVTLDRTTHVDPPPKKPLVPPKRGFRAQHKRGSPGPSRRLSLIPPKRSSVAASKRSSVVASKHSSIAPSKRSSTGRQFVYPDTPKAPLPHRTTFLLPVVRRDSLVATPRYQDDDTLSPSYLDFDSLPSPVEATVYIERSRPLAQTLFFLGFFFPLFWVAGMVIILLPVRTNPDWEMGEASDEAKWKASREHTAELRWAKRCLVALILECVLLVLVIVTIRWGIGSHK